jgi:putative ABC transport system permease protein
MRIMSTIGLLIALAVIGLTVFSLTLAELREHAVVKALGGRTHYLAAVVLPQRCGRSCSPWLWPPSWPPP